MQSLKQKFEIADSLANEITSFLQLQNTWWKTNDDKDLVKLKTQRKNVIKALRKYNPKAHV